MGTLSYTGAEEGTQEEVIVTEDAKTIEETIATPVAEIPVTPVVEEQPSEEE